MWLDPVLLQRVFDPHRDNGHFYPSSLHLVFIYSQIYTLLMFGVGRKMILGPFAVQHYRIKIKLK